MKSATEGRPHLMSRTSRGLLAGYFCLVCILICGVALMPVPGSPVAVFTWSSPVMASEIIARADGQILATSSDGRVAVAATDDATSIDALYSAGARLVTAAWFAKACATLGNSSTARAQY